MPLKVRRSVRKGVDSDNDNDSVKDVIFNDSEEERDLGINDLFDVEISNEGVAKASGTNAPEGPTEAATNNGTTGPIEDPIDATATSATKGPTEFVATNAIEGPTEAAVTNAIWEEVEVEGEPSRNWKKRVSYKLPFNENFIPYVGQTEDNLEDGCDRYGHNASRCQNPLVEGYVPRRSQEPNIENVEASARNGDEEAVVGNGTNNGTQAARNGTEAGGQAAGNEQAAENENAQYTQSCRKRTRQMNSRGDEIIGNATTDKAIGSEKVIGIPDHQNNW
ncbi:hypothetical protein RIF29_19394 [Crotalaria pallida]|uniref:Uncharacterized protein n=1 Tax=Crotalaria pallida TaxID=3830 RepID=A0AAN9IBD3_CROPI